ncbi:hypothetical protein DYB32_004126 [Aphanomyces invadans]|uniref:Uncharacterized protein n=1 Tax=Aphanomyces invadans TaxID=157072 RepID=A0A3R6Z0N0_9STRA|nr:hypothetical protein DYB32_004126 [Aphanomyces invadans]
MRATILWNFQLDGATASAQGSFLGSFLSQTFCSVLQSGFKGSALRTEVMVGLERGIALSRDSRDVARNVLTGVLAVASETLHEVELSRSIKGIDELPGILLAEGGAHVADRDEVGLEQPVEGRVNFWSQTQSIFGSGGTDSVAAKKRMVPE